MQSVEKFTAFDGTNIFYEGTLPGVTESVRMRLGIHPDSQILVFSQSTGRQTDIYLDLPVKRSDQTASSSVALGRPKLGVVGREVTLLPRHWEWLNSQPGGASVALRKLVEMAMRDNVEKDAKRQRHEAAYRFMTALAGDLPGYEEALRCLFANNQQGLEEQINEWPADVKQFTMQLAFSDLS